MVYANKENVKVNDVKKTYQITDGLDDGNMRIAIAVSAFMSVASIVLFIKSFFATTIQFIPGINGVWGHKAICALMFVVSLLILIEGIFYFKKKSKIPHPLISTTLIVYTGLCYGFGIFVSLLEMGAGNLFYIFIVLASLVSVLFYIFPIWSFLISAGAFAFFLYALATVNQNPEAVYTKDNIFNASLLVIILSLISSVRFVEKVRATKIEIKNRTMNRELKKLSYFDALTHLKNRYALRRDYDKYIQKNLIVMLTDVDDFKFFNDNFGHNVGDEILENFSTALRSIFSRDNCYRFGGDEFLVIVSDMSEPDFLNRLELWNDNFSPVEAEGTKLKASCSRGYIFGYAASTEDLRKMIQLSDVQLYEAKRRGKNCSVGLSFNSALEKDSITTFYTRNGKPTGIDSLTGAQNMMYFRNKAWMALNNRSVIGDTIIFIYFDIEHFKRYNELHGFIEGDKLLIALYEALRQFFPNRVIARFSDDHFVVLSYLTGATDAIREVHNYIYDKFSQRVRAGIFIYEREQKMDVTVACDRAGLACDSIREQFDRIYRFFDESLVAEENKQSYILEQFDSALNSGNIRVFYQPIVTISDRKICNFEALTRWEDSVYGTLMPQDFLPVLERSHLIHKLDLFVLHQVCNDIAYCLKREYQVPPISVNISYVDFLMCNMKTELESLLQNSKIPKSHLCMEIPESAFLQKEISIQKEIAELRSQGIQIWLDGFGSGVASLITFEDNFFDAIKISARVLSHFSTNKRVYSILSHIVKIAKEIGFDLIVEGIENEEQLQFLQTMGCQKAQGYLFSKAMNLHDLFSFGGN